MPSPTFSGSATANIPGLPKVIRVSTKPGFTVSTWTPLGARRFRSPWRNTVSPPLAAP